MFSGERTKSKRCSARQRVVARRFVLGEGNPALGLDCELVEGLLSVMYITVSVGEQLYYVYVLGR